MEKRYHVGIQSKEYPSWNKIVILCGAVLEQGVAWDPPREFMKEDPLSEGWIKCPDCLNHPDMPLLLLGAL